MNYYSTLKIPKTASSDEIKKAYRKLAKEHHPDTGGDEDTFKKISEAYNILSDPAKRDLVDMGIDPNEAPGAAPRRRSYTTADIFRDMFGNDPYYRQTPRNSNIKVSVEITLEDVLTGKTLDAEVGLLNGEHKIVNIKIPAGVEHGQQIKFNKMGDTTIKEVPAGDLIVQVFIRPHRTFVRHGDTIACEKTISVWDAILGTTLKVTTLNKDELNIKIPPGTNTNKIFKCKGYGVPNVHTKVNGHLLVKIIVKIPTNLTDEQLETIKLLQKETT